MTAQRVVLDTNVLVSALVFTSGRLAWMRHAWQHGLLTPIACSETVTELVRVLAYPKLRLEQAERDELLADYLPFAEIVRLPDPWPDVRAVRDPHVRVFLALAVTGAADALVTGDADLLMLECVAGIPIVRPDALAGTI